VQAFERPVSTEAQNLAHQSLRAMAADTVTRLIRWPACSLAHAAGDQVGAA